VTGDQELVVHFLADAAGTGVPRDVDLVFFVGGCQYQDEHRVTLSLRFDPESAAFSEVETAYGACVSVSPAGPRRAGAWLGAGCAAAAWLLARRRGRGRPRPR
jgi:hypothetical protein